MPERHDYNRGIAHAASPMNEPEPIFKVLFLSNGEIYEIYARHVYSSDLYGFVVVEEIVFGERTQVIVDPSEERLKSEFKSVSRTYVPAHAVLRIDEVEKAGPGEIRKAADGNVTYLSPRAGDTDVRKA